jgi:hypothetical protein
MVRNIIDTTATYPIIPNTGDGSSDSILRSYLEILRQRVELIVNYSNASEIAFDKLSQTLFIAVSNKSNYSVSRDRCHDDDLASLQHEYRIYFDLISGHFVSNPDSILISCSSALRSHIKPIMDLVSDNTNQISQTAGTPRRVIPRRKNILEMQRDLERTRTLNQAKTERIKKQKPVNKEKSVDDLLKDASNALVKSTTLNKDGTDSRLIPDVPDQEYDDSNDDTNDDSNDDGNDDDEDTNEEKFGDRRDNTELECGYTSKDLEKQIDKISQIRDQEVENIQGMKEQLNEDIDNLCNYNFNVSGDNLNIRKRKEQDEEHLKIFESERRFTYNKMKTRIEKGKLQEWNIPPFFMAKFRIYKYMDENDLLYHDNAYGIYVKLLDELIDEKEETDPYDEVEKVMGIQQRKKILKARNENENEDEYEDEDEDEDEYEDEDDINIEDTDYVSESDTSENNHDTHDDFHEMEEEKENVEEDENTQNLLHKMAWIAHNKLSSDGN